MVDKALYFYILCGCSLLLITIECGTAWFFWRLKQRVETLPRDGMQAKGVITGQGGKGRTRNMLSYSFTTADGRQCKGQLLLQPGFDASIYSKESVVDVLYLDASPSVSCLKMELENRLKSVRILGLIAKVLPFSAFLVVGVLWFCFYQNHLI